MGNPKVFRSSIKADRFAAIENEYGFIRIDFEMPHLELFKQNSYSAWQAKQYSPLPSPHDQNKVINRYCAIWSSIEGINDFNKVYADGKRPDTWIYEHSGNYLVLYHDIHLMMLDEKGTRNHTEIQNSVFNNFIEALVPESDQYKKAMNCFWESKRMLSLELASEN